MTETKKALWLIFWPLKLPGPLGVIDWSGLIGANIALFLAYFYVLKHQELGFFRSSALLAFSVFLSYYAARAVLVFVTLSGRSLGSLTKYGSISMGLFFAGAFAAVAVLSLRTRDLASVSVLFLIAACFTGVWRPSKVAWALALALIDFLLAGGCIVVLFYTRGNAIPAMSMLICLFASFAVAKPVMNSISLPSEVLK